MKTAIITGVSSGVGYETAKFFKKNNYNVIGLARSATKHTELSSVGIQLYDVDLTDFSTTEKIINNIIRDLDSIDVIANVAGTSANGTLENVDIEHAQNEYNVNVFGPMNLIKIVLPKMRQQGYGHIINVSSIISKVVMPLLGWYSSSKIALSQLSDTLRQEVLPFGIQVSTILPSGINTPMAKNNTEFITNSKGTVYERIANIMASQNEQGSKKNINPQDLAQLIYSVAENDHPKNNYSIGDSINQVNILGKILPRKLFTKLANLPFKNTYKK